MMDMCPIALEWHLVIESGQCDVYPNVESAISRPFRWRSTSWCIPPTRNIQLGGSARRKANGKCKGKGKDCTSAGGKGSAMTWRETVTGRSGQLPIQVHNCGWKGREAA